MNCVIRIGRQALLLGVLTTFSASIFADQSPAPSPTGVQVIASGQTKQAEPRKDVELTFFDLQELNAHKGNQILIKFKTLPAANGLPAFMNEFLSQFPVANVGKFYQPKNLANAWTASLKKWRVLTFAEGVNVKNAFLSLQSNTAIEHVSPNAKHTTSATPNDLSPTLWGLHNTGQERELFDYYGNPYYRTGLSDADIDAPEAWDIRTSTDNVVVAVIDTGVDYNHPDLAANIWTNPGEIAGNGIDDDGNGYIDDVHGYDFADKDADPMDTYGHGTHVAGTIGAVGNNGIGISGVAWQTKIMVLKAAQDNSNSLYTADIVDAVLYAADMGARVSNNSYGSLLGNSIALDILLKPMVEAVAYANQAGHLFVASAGNSYADLNGSDLSSPAGILETNVISVAATDDKDKKADFSNYGATEVHIAAPGDRIYSTLPNNSYGTYSGTSMSAPHVTGAAALLFAEKPELTPAEARALIVRTADPLTGLAAENMAGGRLNLFNLLSAAQASGGGSCPSFAATLSAHKTAGRATSQTTGQTCWFSFCYGGTTTYFAVGSNENLGTLSTTNVTLYENSPGYFSKTENCPAGFDNYPVVTLNGLAEEYFVAGPGAYIDAGASASDREDGDLSVSVQATGSVDMSKAGEYILKYQVADSAGNVSLPAYRLVYITDTDSAPEVYLFGPQCILPLFCEALKTPVGSAWIEPGYFAIDLIDRDLTESVFYTDPSATSTASIGGASIQYDVLDSSGNHSRTVDSRLRILFTLDAEQPLALFYTDWLDYTPVSDYYDWKRPAENTDTFGNFFYLGVDYTDDEIAYENFVLQGVEEVDLKSVGTYPLSLNVTDSDGNTATANANVHVVEDVTPPVMTLSGPAEFDVEVDDYVYIPWPSISDDLDRYPRITQTITNTSGVEIEFDSRSEGTYVFTYVGNDGAGNTAGPIVQTVNVVRTGNDHPPRITGYSTSNNPPSIAFSASDIDNDLTAVQLREAGSSSWQSLALESGNWMYYLPTNFYGEKMFDARAIDANGNTSETWYQISLSRWNKPVIDSASMNMNGKVAVITATASDLDDDLSYGEIRIDGNIIVRCTGGAYAFTCSTGELSDGQHTVELYAVDERGNSSASQYFYPEIIAEQPPVIVSASTNVSGTSVTVSGTATDPNNNIVAVYLDTGSQIVACTGTTNFSCQVTGLASGDYEFTGVYAEDSTGLQSSVYGSFNFTINAAPICFTSDNKTHISQGRATQCGSAYLPSACAKGSGTNLGYASTYFNQTSSVQEQSPGYWVKVSSCP